MTNEEMTEKIRQKAGEMAQEKANRGERFSREHFETSKEGWELLKLMMYYKEPVDR